MKEAVGFWLEFTAEIVIIIVIILAAAHVVKEVSSTKPAQAESTNYTVEIDEQDGSAVVYVENYEAITEDKDGLRIRKKGEE